MIQKILFITLVTILIGCKETILKNETIATATLIEKSNAIQRCGARAELHKKEYQDSLDRYDTEQYTDSLIKDDAFINMEALSRYFVLDIRYATNNNFLKQAVYSCAKCYVRGIVAKALINANKELREKGYKIKFFDCYRPHSVQKKMWEIFPKPGYVANPRGGSVHNRGAAIDISLTDLQGNPLDMGTDFDHFGREAHHAYSALSDEVIANRKLLRTTMEKHGFSIIRTEWWHYNYKGGKKYRVSDFTWECE